MTDSDQDKKGSAYSARPPESSEGESASRPTASTEVEQLRERLARLSAELDNFRKRMQREMEAERRYAALPLLRDLLPVVDNLRHAIDAAEIASDPDEMLRGVRMIYDQFIDILRQHHCEEIEAAGRPFDPQLHEAVQQVPTAEQPTGHVLDVVQPGYRLHERVLRPARVIVACPPAQDKGQDPDEHSKAPE